VERASLARPISQGGKCYLTNRVPGRNAADLSDVAFDRTNGPVVIGMRSRSRGCRTERVVWAFPVSNTLPICVCNPSGLDYARDSHPMRD
jgi:hypothetical protein